MTHDPEEALTLSDKVLIVNEGSISQYGTPEEIIQTPGNRFVKDFILNQLEIKRNNIFALFQKEFLRKAQAVSLDMTGRKEKEIKIIYAAILLLFLVFLAVPLIRLLLESFVLGDGIGLANYVQVAEGERFS